MKQMKVLSGHLSRQSRDIHEIKDGLTEKPAEMGAYYCSLPSFRDSYRLVRRIVERNGQSIYLMLCSITDGNGYPIKNQEKLETMAEVLYGALKQSLRRSDSFTRYSPSQYLALLIGTSQENCSLISKRIRKIFVREHRHWSRYLACCISSAAEMEHDKNGLIFKG